MMSVGLQGKGEAIHDIGRAAGGGGGKTQMCKIKNVLTGQVRWVNAKVALVS